MYLMQVWEKLNFYWWRGWGKREIAPSVHPTPTVKTRQCGALISDYISDAARFIDHIFIYKNQKIAPVGWQSSKYDFFRFEATQATNVKKSP
jgi:hypothetical protein